jgi:Spy/CpxP family protein refolding chaperone
MKKPIFLILLVLLGLGSYAQSAQASQPNTKAKTPEQRAEHLTNWMNKKLTLTADQKSKIYDINLKYAKMNQQTRTNDADDKKAMHQELKANESERETEFKAILTPDQFLTFQTAKQELKEKRKGHRKKK